MIVYKLHIAEDFIRDPSLVSSNGPKKGSHVYLNFESLLFAARFGGIVYWYCECEVDPASELICITANVAKILVDKEGSDFKPVPLWEK